MADCCSGTLTNNGARRCSGKFVPEIQKYPLHNPHLNLTTQIYPIITNPAENQWTDEMFRLPFPFFTITPRYSREGGNFEKWILSFAGMTSIFPGPVGISALLAPEWIRGSVAKPPGLQAGEQQQQTERQYWPGCKAHERRIPCHYR